RLRFRPDLNIRVPECEILMATHAVKHFIRTREFFKIPSALETGAENGMWSFARYRTWLDSRTNWFVPDQTTESADAEPAELSGAPADGSMVPLLPKLAEKKTASSSPQTARVRKAAADRIEIEPIESEFGKILKR